MSWDWEKLKDQQQKRGDMPPQMDDFIKKMNKFKLPGGPILVLIVILILMGGSMVYTVGVDEVGVAQRFGKYVRTVQPGLNFKLPAGIEKVTNVRVRRVQKEEFGFSSSQNLQRKGFSSRESENNASLMLTGDLNVALVPWIVQYRIRDPFEYLFKVENVERLLQDLSEAAMRLVVGDRSISEVISKREEIADEAKRVLQAELNQAETGINVVTIEMKRTNVPKPVQPSWNEVNEATQEKEKMIYEAKEEYNKAIPEARGNAEKLIKAAEGYAIDRVNRAKGDAHRFTAVYKEYAKAADVTRRRLYLESLKNFFPKVGEKYIIDAEQKNLLPLLNLQKKQNYGKENGKEK